MEFAVHIGFTGHCTLGGGYFLQGVTKVHGNLPRISAILIYDEQPDCVMEDEINIRIYGKRVEEILTNRSAEANG